MGYRPSPFIQAKPMSIDDLVFGNPSSRDQQIMNSSYYLDCIIPELKKFTPPKNSLSGPELNKLMEFTSVRKDEKDLLYDERLMQEIKKTFIKEGAQEEFIDTISTSIADDVLPVVIKLKYLFNRIRPQQLSWYYNLNLFPDHSYFVNNPSYPSTHTTLTIVTCHVLGNLYPQAYNKIQKIIEEVKSSRLYLGVHYPSDNNMSVVVAKSILDNKEFKMKYHL